MFLIDWRYDNSFITSGLGDKSSLWCKLQTKVGEIRGLFYSGWVTITIGVAVYEYDDTVWVDDDDQLST